jgi:hypothetical protein
VKDELAESNEDFLDLQAETKDAQEMEIELIKGIAQNAESGCANGGTECTDASSEPADPFEAPSSEATGVRRSGSIDISSVLRSVEHRADHIVTELEKQRGTELAKREAARSEYRITGKANEKDFEDKMKALDKKSAADKKSLIAKGADSKRETLTKLTKGWQKVQMRSLLRNNVTSARRQMRLDRLAAKRVLRADRRSQRKLMDKVFMNAMAEYKRYSKRLAKARFTSKTIPKIKKIMLAEIKGNLTLLDLASGNEETLGADVVNDRDICNMKDVESSRFYINQKIRLNIWPPLTAHFKDMRDRLWKALDKIRSTTSSSLVSSVGAVPHVGEIFSAGIPRTVDEVYEKILHAVNTSLSHVRDNIQDRITEAIVNPIMDVVAPKLQSNVSLADLVLPTSQDLAEMARQSKFLGTRSVLVDWGNGLKQARSEAAEQQAAIMKDAYDEAKLMLAEVKSESDLSIEVLKT